jgi:transcription antitermination factor NusG
MQGEFNYRGVRRVEVLFEGYVFVRETDRWWSIRGTRGVAQLLMGCEGPAVIADAELQFFLSGSVDELGYYVDPVMKRYAVGDAVTPKFGPWAGKLGKLSKLDGAGRCELLYSLLGRPVTVTSQVRELA